MDRDWRTLFEQSYATSASPTQERVWRDVLGDEYPDGVDPYSYVTRSELQRFAAELALAPGATLVDVGCGRGGAGLWVAAATGARLLGLDIAENALADARARAARLGADATFQQGAFEATGLQDGAAAAVMSIDALIFTPDKAAALRELRRILPTGGRLVFTSWDYDSQPAGRPPQVPDHRPLLEAAGFEVRSYDETDDWRERMAATGQGLLEAAEDLAAETGQPVESVHAEIQEMNATYATMRRRFLAVASTVDT